MSLATLKQVNESVLHSSRSVSLLTLKQVSDMFALKQVNESVYAQAIQLVCLKSNRSVSLFTLKRVSESCYTHEGEMQQLMRVKCRS